MNENLLKMRNDFINQVKISDMVLGAWNFGSETHGLSDEYSDVDIILLVKGNNFEEFAYSLEYYLKQISDEILLCWPENFNSEAIINNGYLLLKNNNIFQFDVFLMNSEKLDDFMCQIHYRDLKEKDIIFDKRGLVKELMLLDLKGNIWSEDIVYLEKKYWYHANMTSKYLKREDYFKLNNVVHTMLETHISMLLVGFDKITWGGSASKLQFIPKDKQKHLKEYYCSEDFTQVKINLIKCMKEFQIDAKEVHKLKGINYSTYLGNLVINNWLKEIIYII